MKTKLFSKFLLLLVPLLLVSAFTMAQVPPVDTTGLDSWNPFDGPITVTKLLEIFNPLYGAIVIIWGYVAKTLKLKSSKVPFVFVVLAGGLVAGGVFLTQGFSAVGIVISFFASLGVFDLFIKPAERAIRGKTEVPPNPPGAQGPSGLAMC